MQKVNKKLLREFRKLKNPYSRAEFLRDTRKLEKEFRKGSPELNEYFDIVTKYD